MLFIGHIILRTTYKILSNILLSRLTPYAEEIIGDHQCGFGRNSSDNDHILCIPQILEKYGNTMKQFISYLYNSRELKIHLGGRN